MHHHSTRRKTERTSTKTMFNLLRNTRICCNCSFVADRDKIMLMIKLLIPSRSFGGNVFQRNLTVKVCLVESLCHWFSLHCVLTLTSTGCDCAIWQFALLYSFFLCPRFKMTFSTVSEKLLSSNWKIILNITKSSSSCLCSWWCKFQR